MAARKSMSETVREVLKAELSELRAFFEEQAKAAHAERRAERGDWIEAGHQALRELRGLIEADRKKPEAPSPDYLRQLLAMASESGATITIGEVRIEPPRRGS